MPGKKTSNMLVRDIPINVWERIDKLCRERNWKRRDFVTQALRFLEDEVTDPESVKTESKTEPVLIPDIDRLKRDVEVLQGEAKKDQDESKAEPNVDMMGPKRKVSIDQIKPDRARRLIIERPEPSIKRPDSEEVVNQPLTTVYCWSLDCLDNE